TFARMQDPVTLVRDVDNPTKQPFQVEVKVTAAAGVSGQNGSISVPSGKLMVIEHVSARGTSPVGQTLMYSVSTHLIPDLTLRSTILPTTSQPFGNLNFFYASHALRLYGDAPGISVRVDRDASTGTASTSFVVSGYFVDKQF